MFLSYRLFKKYSFLFLILFFVFQKISAQGKSYRDSLVAFRESYINTHEVVGKSDRKYIQFYPVDVSLRILADFEKVNDVDGFNMITASGMKQKYFRYGRLTFKVHDTLVHLSVYRSASLMKQNKYKDYLFVPFGDATSGYESYGGGRYLDFTISDIKDNKLLIDFNKAYNPYCAYTTGYNCPIPPKENLLTVAIPAGEENYGKPVH